MLSFLSKPLIGDLVIRILDNEDKTLLKLKDYLLISTSTKTRTSLLKDKIHGLLKVVPVHRMILLFSGNVLDDKSFIPIDSFELSDITDEDTVCFRSRLCLFVLPRSRNDLEYEQHSTRDQEILEIKKVEEVIVENNNVRKKARRKAKFQLEEFDLAHELETIQCEKFAIVLQNYGYDNEGAFANISINELCGSGLWIPMNAAKRIMELAATILKRLEYKDRKQMTINMEIEQDLIESKRLTTVAIEGLQFQTEDGENTKQEFSKKVDVRRAWEKEEFRNKHNLKSSNNIKELSTMPRKCHNAVLQAKINKIREYFELIHNQENDKNFIEPARILYQITSSPKHKEMQLKNIKIIDPIRSSSVVVHSNKVGLTGIKDTNNNHSNNNNSSSVNNTSVLVSSNITTDYVYCSEISSSFCCIKHTAAITSNRESYISYRKLSNKLELQILLQRLQSTKSGYVKSKTLESLALQRLKHHHCNDFNLITSSVVEHSLLDITEQRRIIKYVQCKEFNIENLFSVLPITWYNPKKFIDKLVEILEQLDREMLIR